MVRGPSCALRSCRSRTGKNISLFRFPRDPERSKAWLLACNREDLLCKTLQYQRLCEKHFEKKYLSNGGGTRKRLFDQAIPTLFSESIKIEIKEEPHPEMTLVEAQEENVFSRCGEFINCQPGPSCSEDDSNQEIKIEIVDHEPGPSSIQYILSCSKTNNNRELTVNVADRKPGPSSVQHIPSCSKDH